MMNNNNMDRDKEKDTNNNELSQGELNQAEVTEKETTVHEPPQRTTTVEKAPAPVPAPSYEIRLWRVGTFSMGITLIALGLFLILARVYDMSVMWYMLKWWPALIIVLGLEMVIYNSLANGKRGAVRITYDIFSIFLVVVFLLCSLVFYIMDSSGVLTAAQRYLLANAQYVEREMVNYSVNDGVQRLVLETESESITLHAYEGQDVRVSAVYKGRFTSREEAETFAEEQLVTQEHLGDTLYLKTYSPYFLRHPVFNHPMPEQEITVFVPQHVNVDILKVRGTLDMHIPKVESNWDINIQGRSVNMYLESADNVHLQAEIFQHGNIGGNVDWDHFEVKDRDDHDSKKPQEKAVKTWGAGEHQITLRQSSGTAVINIKNSSPDI